MSEEDKFGKELKSENIRNILGYNGTGIERYNRLNKILNNKRHLNKILSNKRKRIGMWIVILEIASILAFSVGLGFLITYGILSFFFQFRFQDKTILFVLLIILISGVIVFVVSSYIDNKKYKFKSGLKNYFNN